MIVIAYIAVQAKSKEKVTVSQVYLLESIPIMLSLLITVQLIAFKIGIGEILT